MRVWQLALFLVVIAGLLAASAPFGDWTQELADARELASELLHRDFLRLPAPASWLGTAPSTALREKTREGLDDPNITGLQAYGLAWLAAPREGLLHSSGDVLSANANPLTRKELEQLARRFSDYPEPTAAWLTYELNVSPDLPRFDQAHEHRLSLFQWLRIARVQFPDDVALAAMETDLLVSLGRQGEALACLRGVFGRHRPPLQAPNDALAVRAALPLLKSAPDGRWVGTLLLADKYGYDPLESALYAASAVARWLQRQGRENEALAVELASIDWLRSLQPSRELPELTARADWLKWSANSAADHAAQLGEESLRRKLEGFIKAFELYRSQLEDRSVAARPLSNTFDARARRLCWLTALVGLLLAAFVSAVTAVALGRGEPPTGGRSRPLLWLEPWQLHAAFFTLVVFSLWVPGLRALSDPTAARLCFHTLFVWTPGLTLAGILAGTAVISYWAPFFMLIRPPYRRRAKPRPAKKRRTSDVRKTCLAFHSLVWIELIVALTSARFVLPETVGLDWTPVWVAGVLVLWLGLKFLDGKVMRQTETTGMLPLPSARYVLALRAATACMLMVLLATFCLLISTRFHALESREAEKVYIALMNPAPSDLPELPQELLDAARKLN